MMKHTPGPWVATYFPGKIKGRVVCAVLHSDNRNQDWFVVSEHHRELAEDDARFIAAAPELLEVLVGVEQTLRYSVASIHVSEQQREIWHNEVVKISTAIAKATGETS